jgi:hypothetical protein
VIPPSDASFAACKGASGLLFPLVKWIRILLPNPLVKQSNSLPIVTPLCTSCVIGIIVPNMVSFMELSEEKGDKQRKI